MASSKQMPWQLKGVPWKTEAAFWGWVRGILRKGWSRHPVKLEYIKQHRKRIKNPNPKGKVPEVWGCTCEMCGNDFVQSMIEIDHLNAASSLRCIEDLQGFAERLLVVTFEDIRALCKPCHSIVTLSQKKGVSLEEATLEQKVIAIDKLNVTEVKKWLLERGITPATNKPGRRKQIKEFLMENNE